LFFFIVAERSTPILLRTDRVGTVDDAIVDIVGGCASRRCYRQIVLTDGVNADSLDRSALPSLVGSIPTPILNMNKIFLKGAGVNHN
jgi:hypothetical protein